MNQTYCARAGSRQMKGGISRLRSARRTSNTRKAVAQAYVQSRKAVEIQGGSPKLGSCRP